MGTIYLVRHGQAGFGQPDYDVLSPLGGEQAAALGRHLVAAQRSPDVLVSAPRRRHRESMEALRGAASQELGAVPEAAIWPGFDEFPFGEVLEAACQVHFQAEYDAVVADCAGQNPLHVPHGFVRLFLLAMQPWAEGRLPASESFAAFCTRVESALSRAAAENLQLGEHRTTLVVTSAGAIAAALHVLLGLPIDRMLRLCLSLYNTGVTELRIRPEGLFVVTVNAIPHLLTPSMRTFR